MPPFESRQRRGREIMPVLFQTETRSFQATPPNVGIIAMMMARDPVEEGPPHARRTVALPARRRAGTRSLDAERQLDSRHDIASVSLFELGLELQSILVAGRVLEIQVARHLATVT